MQPPEQQMEQKQVKDGYKTSEFYVTLLIQVIGLLTMAGVIEPTQADSLGKAITTIAGATVAIVSALSYINQRKWLKSK